LDTAEASDQLNKGMTIATTEEMENEGRGWRVPGGRRQREVGHPQIRLNPLNPISFLTFVNLATFVTSV
jgi:hypothetical protein